VLLYSDTVEGAELLIVDDELLFVNSIANVLRNRIHGLQVSTALNGKKALEILAKKKFSLIITDLNMPEVNGFELIAELARLHTNTPVVVISAHLGGRRDPATELGALRCLEKPLDLDEVTAIVRSVVEAGPPSRVTGVTLAGFTQLLEQERKTLSIRVVHESKEGLLVFRDGRLSAARMARLEGDQAALKIFSWNEARFDLVPFNPPVRDTVQQSLGMLLMESMRINDEVESGRFPTAAVYQTYPPKDDPGLEPNNLFDSANTHQKVESKSTFNQPKERGNTMANVATALEMAMAIDGAIGVAIVDFESGMSLGQSGGNPNFNIDVAAAGNTDVVRAKMKVMNDLGLRQGIEDILITLDTQYHLIRPLKAGGGLFMYLAVDRTKGNLAMARHKLSAIEKELKL
jgi:DNA-binding response OmpR family regulator